LGATDFTALLPTGARQLGTSGLGHAKTKKTLVLVLTALMLAEVLVILSLTPARAQSVNGPPEVLASYTLSSIDVDVYYSVKVKFRDNDNLLNVDEVWLKLYDNSLSQGAPDNVQNHYTFKWIRGEGFSEVGPRASNEHLNVGACSPGSDLVTTDNWTFRIKLDVTAEPGSWNLWAKVVGNAGHQDNEEFTNKFTVNPYVPVPTAKRESRPPFFENEWVKESSPVLEPDGSGFDSYAVYNPAVVYHNDNFYLFYRAQTGSGGVSCIGMATSEDGIHFQMRENAIIAPTSGWYDSNGCEDPRIVKVGDEYWITYTAYDGSNVRQALATSTDLENWVKRGLMFSETSWRSKAGAILGEYKDGVVHPLKINGEYWMYYEHEGMGDLYYATSENLYSWTSGDSWIVMERRPNYFDSGSIEIGPPPMLLEHGILLIYDSCDKWGGKFGVGWAILSQENPTKIIARCEEPFLWPEYSWENVGQVNNVTFAEGLVENGGQWWLYYGAADMRVGLARAPVRENSVLWSVETRDEWKEGTRDNEISVHKVPGGIGLVTTTDVRGWWRFDEGTGTVAHDASDFGNDGTISGAEWTEGESDNALEFLIDNIYDRVDVGDKSSLEGFSEGLTISAWIHPYSKPQWGEIVKKDSVYLLRVNETGPGTVVFMVWDNGGTKYVLEVPSAYFPNNEWTMITATWDGCKMSVYSNDAFLAGERNASFDRLATSSKSFRIGNDYPDHTEPFDGKIDEVMIFSRALTEDEIRHLYNHPGLQEGALSGEWTSAWQDFGVVVLPENLEVLASVGAGENAWVAVEVSKDNGSSVEDNLGWQLLENGDNTIDMSSLSDCQFARVKFRLETENMTHSPSIESFTLDGRGLRLMVSTDSASFAGDNSVTLMGRLIDLENEETRVWFKWRENGATSWNETEKHVASWRTAFSKNISGLVENKVYEFRAVAEDNTSGENTTGPILTFIMDRTPPSAFRLIYPPDNAVIPENKADNLRWEASSDNGSGLSHYEVWINENNIDNVVENQYTTPPLPKDNYQWYVIAVDRLGNRRESDNTFTFATGISPEPFKLLAPHGSYTLENRVVLSWENSSSRVNHLDKYEVWINGAKVGTVSAGCTYYATPELQQGSYQWYVVAIDNVGNWRQSENMFTFGVGTPPPYPRREFSDGFESGNLDNYVSSNMEITHSALIGSHSAQCTGTGAGYAYVSDVMLGNEEGKVSVIFKLDGSDSKPGVGFASEDGSWVYAVADPAQGILRVERKGHDSVYGTVPWEYWKDKNDQPRYNWGTERQEDNFYMLDVEREGTGGLSLENNYRLTLYFSRRSKCAIAVLEELSGFVFARVRTVVDITPEHPFFLSTGPVRFDNFHFDFVDTWYYEWEVDLPCNPVLSPSGSGFDSKGAFNPGVWYKDGVFYMIYRASVNPSGSGQSTIGLAKSTDGFHFTKYGEVIDRGRQEEDPELIWPEGSDRFYAEYTDVAGGIDSYLDWSLDNCGTWTNVSHPMAGGKVVSIIDTWMWSQLDEIEWNGENYRYFVTREDAAGVTVLSDSITGPWVTGPNNGLNASSETWSDWGEPAGDGFVDADGNIRILTCASTAEGYVGGPEATVSETLWSGTNPGQLIARGTIPWCPVYFGDAPGGATGDAWNDGPNFPGQTILVDNWLWCYYGANDTSVGLARCYYGPVFEYRNLMISKGIVDPKEPAVVSLVVRNVGSVNGQENVRLYIDNELENSRIVTLGRDNETTVEFIVTINEGGVYAVRAGGMLSTLWVVPPAVAGVTPENGSKALVNENVIVRFNKSMNASITPTLTQTTGTLVTYTFDGWSVDNTVVTWIHDNDWTPGETITLKISGYQDLRGNAGENYTWSFTTLAGAIATGPTGYSNNRNVLITYSYSGTPDNVKIYYTTDNGTTWILAGTDKPVDGSLNWTAPKDNTYWWAAVAIGTEEDPHTGEPEAGPLVIDTVPPPPPENLAADPSGWTSTNSFTVSWTNPPDLSRIAGAYYKLNDEPTSDNDGTLVVGDNIISISGIKATRQGPSTINVWLKDKAGNANHENSSSCLLRLDNVAPHAFKLTSPENGKRISDNTPTLIWENSSDNESGLWHYEVWLDGINVENVAENLCTTHELSRAPHTWYIAAVDNARNKRVSENVFTFTVTVEDNTPPRSFKLVSPENNATIDDPTPILTWENSSDNESGLWHYEVWLDGINVENVSPDRTSYKTQMLSEGSHWWYVVAVDNAVNKTRSDNIFTFTVRAIRAINYVDPFIGTMYGHTSPGSAVPFAMTTWDPVRITQASGIGYPYEYYDTGGYPDVLYTPPIAGFRGSHFPSGSCMSDYACITIMPESGDLVLGPDRASSFSHLDEEASPGYYAVTLDDYGIRAEATSTVRAGIFKFKFSQSGNGHILVDTQLGTGYAKIIQDNNEIVGYSDVGSYKGAKGIKGYFVIKINKSFSSYGTWNQADNGHLGQGEITAYNSGAWVTFSASAGETIMVKASISFISIDQARTNLNSEIPDWNFDRVRSSAENIWENELDKIEVVSASEDQKRIFYTALYHSLLLPRVSSEGNQYYSVFDGRVHTCSGYQFYNDFSEWDIFRSEQALLILLEPDRVADMCQSLVDMYKQCGWTPKWPNPAESGIMIGTHSDSMIAESYLKGITDFDVENAYEGMMKNAMENNELGFEARAGIYWYKTLGYVPAGITLSEQGNEGTSLTLEYAYDDWCIAQLAKALGRDNDHDYFMNRAAYYKNVFDSSVGFVRGRNSNGSWAESRFDPRGFYPWLTQPNEGDPWQYTWSVMHDIRGLKVLIDGSSSNPNYPGDFYTKLETLFQESDEAQLISENKYAEHGTVRYYWQGNEPDLHVPYLFDYCDKPWRTQFWVNNIMKTRYRLYPYGLPGNDDCGQMSSWYVFSAMGFYPVTPASCTYEIGSPIFDKVTIHLGNGKDFVIEAQNVSNNNIYIQSATLNGNSLNKSWFRHSELADGGTLAFVMGSTPNTNWGIDLPPPSMSDPRLVVENLVINPEIVGPGENVVISVDVKNIGEVEDSTLIELEIGGEIVDNENVTLGPDESKPVSFTISENIPGEYSVRIGSVRAGYLIGSFKVIEEVYFVVENLAITPENVDPGENITISVDVANIGWVEGSELIELEIGGEIVDNENVTLGPDESKPVSFTISENIPGEYSVRIGVFRYNEVEIGSFTVRGEVHFVVENLVISPEVVEPDENVTISVDVVNVGENKGSKLLKLEIDNVVVDSTSIILDPSESRRVSFIVSRDVPGVYLVRIDNLSGSFEVVVRRARFVVENLVISPEVVEPGENVAISVDVKNIGTIEGTYIVTLRIENAIEEIKSVMLDEGETGNVAFTVSRDNEGTYHVDVDGLTGSFSVVALSPPGPPWIIVTALLLVAGIAAITLYLWRGPR